MSAMLLIHDGLDDDEEEEEEEEEDDNSIYLAGIFI